MGLPGITIDVGDHICAIYRGTAGRDEVLVPYLREALSAGDKCICVMDDPCAETVLAQLDEHVDTDVSRCSGQFEFLRSEVTYLSDGYFAIEEMLDFWERGISGALGADGYGFVRAVGEMTWALRDVPGVALLVRYESELNRFLPRYPQVILCMYDLEKFTSGNILLDLLRTHPKLLLSGRVVDNPWFTGPDEYPAAGA